MAIDEHVRIVRMGPQTIRAWRIENPDVQLDVSHSDLGSINLRGADLRNANLGHANLSGADLSGANLEFAWLHYAMLAGATLNDANLHGADLTGANATEAWLQRTNLSSALVQHADLSDVDLTDANLKEANLRGVALLHSVLDRADLSKARVFGLSAWDVSLIDTIQQELEITPFGASVTVDDIQVAQFVYLLLQNDKIRDAIDTITSKAVLILGRFTPERKAVLDAIREELRRHDYVPMMFDFDKPTDKDFTETIMTLAGMSRFIIADITNPKSSPLELQATVPNYMVPFVPIIQEGEKPFSMFKDLHGKYDWVLKPLEYDTADNLVEKLEKGIINRALEKRNELILRKATDLQTVKLEDL